MSEGLPTTTSPLDGANVPQAGIYKGYNVHVTLAGVIVARGQEMRFTINNNLEAYYEVGSRNPWYVEGNFDGRGIIRGFVFDTMKMRLAMGSARDIVGINESITTVDGTTLLNSNDGTTPINLTPDAGTQPWWKLFKFNITAELHIDGTDKYMEYKLADCKIDTYQMGFTQDSEVGETVTFVFPRAGVRMATGTTTELSQ